MKYIWLKQSWGDYNRLGVVHKGSHSDKGGWGNQGFCDDNTKALVMENFSLPGGKTSDRPTC